MTRSMTMKLAMLVLLALSAIGLSACGAGTSTPPNVVGSAEAPEVVPTTEYQLGSGDRVRVIVFRHEDLSGEFQLDGTGRFAMPLVGTIDANGLTTRQLEEAIQKAYTDGEYLIQPQISVAVTNFRPFYITGEVNRPGSYEYVDGMTVDQAISLAGGFGYRAAKDEVMLKRGGSNAPSVIVAGGQRVSPGDIIEVPERFF
ncbi:MAG TPA: polysaccharide biosynthesis/export family protein [Geminicoccus sp.]|jgi:polysaccharide export outer membrane protein|uniref:polysaccharide biosynthesis/export family protein n=1 Tax=Geminicoccus sp. TaxID=2024832 RepID=UPI002E3621A2|nr:polysaccharide biosynthesis/export family protein [Geminicoccus sp.]HEX2524955.1 polysaccharide biosynthesis/export family protein [Geminicoccus sp.]